MWLTRSRILSTKNCVLIGVTENGEFSEEDWTNLDIDRRNICRGISTDYSYVLVKEMLFPMHETAASHLVGGNLRGHHSTITSQPWSNAS